MVLYACMYCVFIFLLHRESPDLILVDEPLISEVVLSHTGGVAGEDSARRGRVAAHSAAMGGRHRQAATRSARWAS
jgi:hypothetical protein